MNDEFWATEYTKLAFAPMRKTVEEHEDEDNRSKTMKRLGVPDRASSFLNDMLKAPRKLSGVVIPPKPFMPGSKFLGTGAGIGATAGALGVPRHVAETAPASQLLAGATKGLPQNQRR